MPALDALLQRKAMLDSLHTPEWRSFAHGFIEQTGDIEARQADHGERPDWLGDEHQLTAETERTLQLAETFTVSPTMMALVDADADSWPDEEEWTLDDLPSPAGFLWAPSPIRDMGVDGWPTGASAVTWHIVGGRVRFVLLFPKTFPGVYEAFAQEGPERAERIRWFNALPFLLPLQVYQLRPGVLPYAARLSKPLPEGIRDDIKVWLDEGELKAEISGRAQDWIDTHSADFIGRPDRILSFLFSALRIMREPVAVVERHGLPANMRKRVSTRKLRNLHVTVIEYRRPASHPQAGMTWTLSHRYYRRAHKRRVWYKDADTGERKQRVVHIPGTICGDPSLPLMLREHVNALTR